MLSAVLRKKVGLDFWGCCLVCVLPVVIEGELLYLQQTGLWAKKWLSLITHFSPWWEQSGRPQTLPSHSWGEGLCYLGGGLITTQKPWFWEWSHKNILSLPICLKIIKDMKLSESCDGIYHFPWPQKAHRLLAGVVQEGRKVRMKTTLLNPFVWISTEALQWKSVEGIYRICAVRVV